MDNPPKGVRIAVMDCLLPLLFQSLAGSHVALPAYAFEAPPRLNGVGNTAIQPGKNRYGQAWPNELASENFIVAWENGNGSTALAENTLSVLETSWEALVKQGEWRAPVSSEKYLLWVILTPELSGTGFTTSYSTSDFPGGYPVIYLNPDHAENTAFWASLSAHEFAHTLQYAHRSYSTNPEDPWYWEASAEWQAELALPEVNAYGAQSRYYSEQSHFVYSSMENAHQYGMFVLNAHIEEHMTGPGGLKAIWEEAGQHPNKNWALLIAESVGTPIEEIFGGFTQNMSTLNFQDGALYFPPKIQGKLNENTTGRLAYLGTHYWKATTDSAVEAVGQVILASPSGFGESVVVHAGEKLTVTGLNSNNLAPYSLTLAPIPPDSGMNDSGDTADTDARLPENPSTCACNSAPSQKAPFWIVVSACLFFFKRRAPRRPFSS